MREYQRFSTAKNPNGQLIASRDGRLLCSPRDPVREANIWIEKQKLTGSDLDIAVLGAGAGHHINAIQNLCPNARITVLELDEDTLNFFQTLPISQAVKCINETTEFEHILFDAILSFRPSWTGYEKKYLDVYFKLTQRDILSEASFRLKGYDFDEADKRATTQNLNEEDVKLWRVLREMVK